MSEIEVPLQLPMVAGQRMNVPRDVDDMIGEEEVERLLLSER